MTSHRTSEERRESVRHVARLVANPGAIAEHGVMAERLATGSPIVVCEWDTRVGEVSERLYYHARRGRPRAIVAIRRGDILHTLMSDGETPLDGVWLGGDEIHEDSPIGMVWDALEQMQVNASCAKSITEHGFVSVGKFALTST